MAVDVLKWSCGGTGDGNGLISTDLFDNCHQGRDTSAVQLSGFIHVSLHHASRVA